MGREPLRQYGEVSCEIKGLDLPCKISELFADCCFLRVLDIAAGKGGYQQYLLKK